MAADLSRQSAARLKNSVSRMVQSSVDLHADFHCHSGLIQGVLGVFRAFDWFNFGADLFGQGVDLAIGRRCHFRPRRLGSSGSMLSALFAVGTRMNEEWMDVGSNVAAISILPVTTSLIQVSPLRTAIY